VTVGLVLAAALGYGALRLRPAPPPEFRVVVGLVGSDLPREQRPRNDAQRLALVRRYAGEAERLAAAGARIVVLPEVIAISSEPAAEEAIRSLLAAAAARARVSLVAGLGHRTPRGLFNEAWVFAETGPALRRTADR
jgi:apolipoprotein N-acyltransferase